MTKKSDTLSLYTHLNPEVVAQYKKRNHVWALYYQDELQSSLEALTHSLFPEATSPDQVWHSTTPQGQKRTWVETQDWLSQQMNRKPRRRVAVIVNHPGQKKEFVKPKRERKMKRSGPLVVKDRTLAEVLHASLALPIPATSLPPSPPEVVTIEDDTDTPSPSSAAVSPEEAEIQEAITESKHIETWVRTWRYSDWNEANVHKYLGRSWRDPDDDPILKRIVRVRRYGVRARYEFECEFISLHYQKTAPPLLYRNPAYIGTKRSTPLCWVKYTDLIGNPHYVRFLRDAGFCMEKEKLRHLEHMPDPDASDGLEDFENGTVMVDKKKKIKRRRPDQWTVMTFPCCSEASPSSSPHKADAAEDDDMDMDQE